MHPEFLELFMSLSYNEQLMYVLLRSCEANPDIIDMCRAVMPEKNVQTLSTHSSSDEESQDEEPQEAKRKIEGFPGEKELDERLGPWDDDSSLPSDVDDYDDVRVLEIKTLTGDTTEK